MTGYRSGVMVGDADAIKIAQTVAKPYRHRLA